jgi:hypothetical protein
MKALMKHAVDLIYALPVLRDRDPEEYQFSIEEYYTRDRRLVRWDDPEPIALSSRRPPPPHEADRRDPLRPASPAGA